VLLAGRLRAYKRVDLALRAWPQVIAARPDATLHLVGDGPEAARCGALVAELGLARSVVLHGQLADAADVRRHLGSAELLLLPSTREGQSTVVLEAMALGTPILAADGPETAVGDFLGRDASAAGVLLPATADAGAWAARIVGLLGDAPLRARLGAEGRRRAADLAWDTQIAPRIDAYYQETIARQRGPRAR
jgi:glycosyltransferase involved in cell wall biosynthesis